MMFELSVESSTVQTLARARLISVHRLYNSHALPPTLAYYHMFGNRARDLESRLRQTANVRFTFLFSCYN